MNLLPGRQAALPRVLLLMMTAASWFSLLWYAALAAHHCLDCRLSFLLDDVGRAINETPSYFLRQASLTSHSLSLLLDNCGALLAMLPYHTFYCVHQHSLIDTTICLYHLYLQQDGG
jgi:hypothetical protein